MKRDLLGGILIIIGINLVENFSKHGNETSGSLKAGKFPHQLSTIQLDTHMNGWMIDKYIGRKREGVVK